MAKWEDLLPLVLPVVRNVPKQAAMVEIRGAAKTFCDRSHYWRETLDAMQFIPGNATAEMEPPSGASVICVLSLRLDGVELIPNADYTATASEITLARVPSQAQVGVVHCALRPSLGAAGMPDSLANEWGDEIAKGAVASLKMQAGAEWFDASGASINREIFEDAIATAKRRALQGMAQNNLQVRPRRLW